MKPDLDRSDARTFRNPTPNGLYIYIGPLNTCLADPGPPYIRRSLGYPPALSLAWPSLQFTEGPRGVKLRVQTRRTPLAARMDAQVGSDPALSGENKKNFR